MIQKNLENQKQKLQRSHKDLNQNRHGDNMRNRKKIQLLGDNNL